MKGVLQQFESPSQGEFAHPVGLVHLASALMSSADGPAVGHLDVEQADLFNATLRKPFIPELLLTTMHACLGQGRGSVFEIENRKR